MIDTSAKIRIGVSKQPIDRENAGVHFKIEHKTVAVDDLVGLIQSGHALGAITSGKHVYENFLARQDIQLDIDVINVATMDIDPKGELRHFSPLEYFTNHPFFKEFGYVAYATRTPGHCLSLIHISEPTRPY